jgi:hypothetical protein
MKYMVFFLLVHPRDGVATIDDAIDTYFGYEYNYTLPSFEESRDKLT